MADATLTINSNIDDVVATLESLLGSLDGTAASARSAGTAIDESMAVGAAATNKVVLGAEKATLSLDGLKAAAEKVSGGFSGIGVSADSSLGKVGGLAGGVSNLGSAFMGLTPATAVLLGVGAAIFGVASLMGDAISKAAALQSSMVLIQNTVRAQGGDWKNASAEVLAWADAQEKATTYGRDETVPALQKLMAAGMGLSDAQKSVRVAEDLAAGSGMSLEEATRSLQEAESGRIGMLGRLGIVTKEQVKTGMSYSAMLGLIEKKMGGDASASADTYAGKMKQLGNAWTTFLQDVGTKFLPILTVVITGLDNFVQNLDTDFKKGEGSVTHFENKYAVVFTALKDTMTGYIVFERVVWDTLVNIIHAAWDVIAGIFKIAFDEIKGVFIIFKDFFTGHWSALGGDITNLAKQLWNDVRSIFGNAFTDLQTGFGNFGSNLITIAERLGTGLKNALIAPFAAIGDAMAGHFAKAKADLGSIVTGFTGLLGNLKSWSFGNDMFSGIAGAFSAPAGAGANPADTNTGVTGTVGGGRGGAAHKGAHAGAHAGHKGAGANLGEFTEAADDFGPAAASAKSFAEQLKALAAVTKDNKASTADYKNALNEAKYVLEEVTRAEAAANTVAVQKIAAYEAARVAYDKYVARLKNGVPTSEASKQEAEKLKKAMDNDAVAAKNAQKAHEALNTTLTKSQTIVNTLTTDTTKFSVAYHAFTKQTDKDDKESLDTFEKTNAEKLAYYQHLMSELGALDRNNLAQYEALYKKEASAQLAIDEQTKAKEKAILDEEKADVTTFISDVLVQHKSLKTALDGIWNQILQDFIKIITKMIVESKLFAQVSNFLGLGTSGSSTQSNTSSGTSSVASTILSDLSPTAATKTTGSPSGVTPGSATADANTKTTEQMQHSLGAVIGGAIMGAAVGAAIAPGNPWAEGLGALGGAAGEYFGGPVGEAVGSAVGSAIGSLFGPHWTPTQQPDISEPTYGTQWDYGQFTTDMNGAPGQFNGATYDPAAADSTAAGAKSLAQQLIAWEATAKSSTMTAGQQALFAQLQALGNNLSIASEKQGVYTLGDGKTISVKDYMQLISQIEQIPGAPGSGTGGPLPVYNIANVAPDFNAINMSQVGTYDPATGTYSGTGTPSTPTTPVPHNIPTPPGIVRTVGPFTINVEGSVTAAEDLAQLVSEAIARSLTMNRFNTGFAV